MRYVWSQVSRQALENLAASVSAEQDAGGIQLPEVAAALKQVRAEATPAPRTQAEVDAEIAQLARQCVELEWSEEAQAPWDRLTELCREPTAPEVVPVVVFQMTKRTEGVVEQVTTQAEVSPAPGQPAPSPRELLSAPVSETPGSLQALLLAAFSHRQGEGVRWHPGLAPTLAQIKDWDRATFEQVARWARLEHAFAHPVAGIEYPEREPVPRAVADCVDQNEQAAQAAQDKPPKKKRARAKRTAPAVAK